MSARSSDKGAANPILGTSTRLKGRDLTSSSHVAAVTLVIILVRVLQVVREPASSSGGARVSALRKADRYDRWSDTKESPTSATSEGPPSGKRLCAMRYVASVC